MRHSDSYLPLQAREGPYDVLAWREESRFFSRFLLGFLRYKPAHHREFSTDVLTASLLETSGKHQG